MTFFLSTEMNGSLIAIYARQSVDRADSISIEQQIQELCRYEAKGEVCKTYTDRGTAEKY